MKSTEQKFYKIKNDELYETYEFRTIRPEEADEAAEMEQICFPPNEACSREHMIERIKAASDLFLVAMDRKTGKMAGFLNGIATDEYNFRDEFLPMPEPIFREQRTSCCLDWMCCRSTAGRGLRESLCITTAAESRIAKETGWY